MAMKIDSHIFKGMQCDKHPSMQEAEYYTYAKNIRLIAGRQDGDEQSVRNSGNTLSITPEESSAPVYLEAEVGEFYLGHCVLGNSRVILFSGSYNDDGDLDTYITDIFNIHHEQASSRLLFKGNLGMDCWGGMETLGVIENSKIQKVYWVDTKNKPRVINVGYDEDLEIYPYIKFSEVTDNNEEAKTQFDFVPTLKLQENIKINRIDNVGSFSPGVIQYAFTYYNKYGRESNIFYTSPLQYISHTKRGGKPDSTIANTFIINIDNYQTDFDYIRIFSIHRTSIDMVPTVKRIADVPIDKSGATLSFSDPGTIGDIVDPTELLYIGGEDIMATAITAKDGTMFLGNLKITRNAVSSIVKPDVNTIKSSITTFLTEYELKALDSSSGYYNYVSCLNKSNPGFKTGEHYRLGLQFQHKNGKWSEPVFIDDYTVDRVNPTLRKKTDDSSKNILYIPNIKVTLNIDLDMISSLNDAGYIKVRGVCVLPTIKDRLILTQGMLCPTVYSKTGRKNSAPFAQSSWFLRPNVPKTLITGENSDKYKFNYNALGNVASFLHLDSLGSPSGYDGEIEGAASVFEDKDFYVDQSILTMHSPEIEFDTSFTDLYNDNYKLQLVGVINFTANTSDLDIQTSTPATNEMQGFLKPHINVLNQSKEAGRSLIAGAFWNDKIITQDSNGNYKAERDAEKVNYMVYPWQSAGSLNNDNNRPSDKGVRTAVLSKKKMSNLKFSDFNYYFNKDTLNKEKYDISAVQLFDSDEVTMLKIPYINSEASLGDVTYYGNIDTLLNGTGHKYGTKYENTTPIVIPSVYGADDQTKESLPVRMKYKSTKHLIFSLKADEYRPVILPNITKTITEGGVQKEVQVVEAVAENQKDNMFWLKTADTSESPQEFERITYELKSWVLLGNKCTVDNQYPKINELIIDTKNSAIYKITGINYKQGSSGAPLTEVEDVNVYAYDTMGKYFIYEKGSVVTKYKGATYSSVEIYDPIIEVSENSYRIKQHSINDENITYPFLYLGELYREPIPETDFGGNSEEAIRNNLWLPAGEPVELSTESSTEVIYSIGDTWYQRYDCLKTYPFTLEDENSIVEIGSFMCETRVNIDGRYDKNRGNSSNLTTMPTNFNLLNEVYSQHNNFFNYRLLDEDYYKINSYNSEVTWSKEKQNGADIDIWTNINMSNTLDMGGNYGTISSLRTFNNEIYCFQNSALSRIIFNPRVQIPSSDSVPIEISNSYKVEGKQVVSTQIGCSINTFTCTAPSGCYFINTLNRHLYYIGKEGLVDISTINNFNSYFKDRLNYIYSFDTFNSEDWEVPVLYYDNYNNDLYIVSSAPALCYSETLGQFVSFLDYDMCAMFNIYNDFYAFKSVPYCDKSGKELGNKLVMFLLRNNMCDRNVNINSFGKFPGKVQESGIFTYLTLSDNNMRESAIEFVSNAEGNIDKIFTDIMIRSDFYNKNDFVAMTDSCTSRLSVKNEFSDTQTSFIKNFNYQTTSSTNSTILNYTSKFRMTKLSLPRLSNDSISRFRGTWAKVFLKLTLKNYYNHFSIHDLNVLYYN